MERLNLIEISAREMIEHHHRSRDAVASPTGFEPVLPT